MTTHSDRSRREKLSSNYRLSLQCMSDNAYNAYKGRVSEFCGSGKNSNIAMLGQEESDRLYHHNRTADQPSIEKSAPVKQRSRETDAYHRNHIANKPSTRELQQPSQRPREADSRQNLAAPSTKRHHPRSPSPRASKKSKHHRSPTTVHPDRKHPRNPTEQRPPASHRSLGHHEQRHEQPTMKRKHAEIEISPPRFHTYSNRRSPSPNASKKTKYHQSHSTTHHDRKHTQKPTKDRHPISNHSLGHHSSRYERPDTKRKRTEILDLSEDDNSFSRHFNSSRVNAPSSKRHQSHATDRNDRKHTKSKAHRPPVSHRSRGHRKPKHDERLAAQRSWSQIRELIVDSSDDTADPPPNFDSDRLAAPQQKRQQSPAKHTKVEKAPSLSNREIAIDFDPLTIANDILRALGKHPTLPALNAHMFGRDSVGQRNRKVTTNSKQR